MNLSVIPFFHQHTGTASYIVVDQSQRYAVVIDSVLDFDSASGEVASTLADEQLKYLDQHNLSLVWILDTHIHADHLTAASYLANRSKAKSVIGKGIAKTQQRFRLMFPNGNQETSVENLFDKLVAEGDTLSFGDNEIRVMDTPGHTDDSVSYLIDDNTFVGDTLFMPDSGTARCDFPGGDAHKLYQSVQRIHALPEDTKIWVCHDYQPNGREVRMQTTVADSKQNIHLRHQVSESAFVHMRNERDSTLPVPKLLYPSLQVNIRGGRLPKPSDNGKRYFAIPISNLTHSDM
ncbi:MAG: MBL fold metallo-hydrolase [Aliiglaciecola sp.]